MAVMLFLIFTALVPKYEGSATILVMLFLYAVMFDALLVLAVGRRRG